MRPSEFRGRLGNASGTLQLDAEHPAGSSFEVTVPTDSANTPADKLTEELKGDHWLDAKANPQITFKAKSVTVTGPQTAIACLAHALRLKDFPASSLIVVAFPIVYGELLRSTGDEDFKRVCTEN